MMAHGERVVVARVAVARTICVALVIAVFLALLLYGGFAKGHIAFVDGRPVRDTVGYSGLTLCVAWLLAMTLPYVARAMFGGGPGLYLEDGRLVFLWRWIKAIPTDQIFAITAGPEGVFYGEPMSLTFNLADDRSFTLYTIWFNTPVAEMLAELKAGGISAAVRGLAEAPPTPSNDHPTHGRRRRSGTGQGQ